MERKKIITTARIPEISAIYYALLQSGYGFYSVGRSREKTAPVESYAGVEKVPDFFAAAKQNTCEIYPWWPRAAICETAVFYLRPDRLGFDGFEAFFRQIMTAGNISDEERNDSLWSWIRGFPAALSAVMDSPGFLRYLEWEEKEVSLRLAERGTELSDLEHRIYTCMEKYASPVKKIGIYLSPIKCAYSADYHLIGDSFVYSSGEFSADSVLHEFLHHVVHPVVTEKAASAVLKDGSVKAIDGSYLRAGELNAFEELAVRRLTEDIMSGYYPEKLEDYIISAK